VKIVNSIEINAAADVVFGWLEDPEKAMVWQTSVTGGEIIEEKPGLVGTTFREYVEEEGGEAGRRAEMLGVVTGCEKNSSLSFHLESDFNIVDVTFSLEEENGVTRVIQTADMRFKGALRVLSLVFGAGIRKKIETQARAEFVALKELCEKES
jgi:hypothetical protein